MYIGIVDKNDIYRGAERALTSGSFQDDENFDNLLNVYFDYVENIELRSLEYENVKTIPGGIMSKYKFFIRYNANCELILVDNKPIDIDEEIEFLGIDVLRDAETMLEYNPPWNVNVNGLFTNYEDADLFINEYRQNNPNDNIQPHMAYVYRYNDSELIKSLKSFSDGWQEKVNGVFLDKLNSYIELEELSSISDMFDVYKTSKLYDRNEIYILICKNINNKKNNTEVAESIIEWANTNNKTGRYIVVMPVDKLDINDCTYGRDGIKIHFINQSKIRRRIVYNKKIKYPGAEIIKRFLSLYKSSFEYCKKHEAKQVECTYFCDVYNPNKELTSIPIIDESKNIDSRRYIHRFIGDESEEFIILTKFMGGALPFVVKGNTLIVGTVDKIYYIDLKTKKISKKYYIPSRCMDICLASDKVVLVCEKDVILVNSEGSIKLSHKSGEMIVRYSVRKEKMTILLMNGKKKTINFQNRLDIFGLFR